MAQSKWSGYVNLNLNVGIPYYDCGWLGSLEAGEYAFGTAWGEIAPFAAGGDSVGTLAPTEPEASLSGTALARQLGAQGEDLVGIDQAVAQTRHAWTLASRPRVRILAWEGSRRAGAD